MNEPKKQSAVSVSAQQALEATAGIRARGGVDVLDLTMRALWDVYKGAREEVTLGRAEVFVLLGAISDGKRATESARVTARDARARADRMKGRLRNEVRDLKARMRELEAAIEGLNE